MIRRRAFAALWFGQFVTVAGLTVVIPLLPFYLAGLGIEPRHVAWWTGVSLAAPAVTQVLTGPLWGWVGDRYGRKTMVVRALAGLALSLGLMALAVTPAQFLACRLLQGLCGGVVPASATFAASFAKPGRRGRALGGLFTATGAGSLVGPLLGGLLAGRYGFGPLFGCVAALLAVAVVLTATLLPKPVRVPRQDRIDQPSVREVTGWLLRKRHVRALVLAGLAGQAATYALVVVFAPRVGQLTDSVGEAISWVGALQAVTWAASLGSAPWWGARNDRRRPSRSFAWAGAGCALAVTLQAFPADPELLVPLRLLQGLCFAALAQSVLHVVGRALPGTAQGAGLGVTNSLLELGQVVGPLGGALAASLLPAPGAFAAIGAMFVVSAALAIYSARLAPPAPTPSVPHAETGVVP